MKTLLVQSDLMCGTEDSRRIVASARELDQGDAGRATPLLGFAKEGPKNMGL